MTNKKWKDLCDCCGEFEYDVHGYEGKVLCPACATKAGYKLWQKGKESEEVEETVQVNPVGKEKFYENGNRACTENETEEGKKKLTFFEDGQVVKTKEFESKTGAYKARTKWIGKIK